MDYIQINKASWNARTAVHIESEFYDNQNFIKGKTSLNDIELNMLGDVSGKRILHLQCHFGQDSISLARMGASVTGVDLSDQAIKSARELSEKSNTDTTFICCDLYDLPNHLNETFDMVFTSYGTIGWLPDVKQWAKIVSQFLKPQGRLVFVEFHPVVWMFDDDFKTVKYRYFTSDPIVEEETGTYADKDAEIKAECITWNHGMGEVVNALINEGMTINGLDEFDYSPYDCFNQTVEVGSKQYRIKHLEDKIPMVYAIKAEKRG